MLWNTQMHKFNVFSAFEIKYGSWFTAALYTLTLSGMGIKSELKKSESMHLYLIFGFSDIIVDKLFS